MRVDVCNDFCESDEEMTRKFAYRGVTIVEIGFMPNQGAYLIKDALGFYHGALANEQVVEII